jgi:hypothetical protein
VGFSPSKSKENLCSYIHQTYAWDLVMLINSDNEI